VKGDALVHVSSSVADHPALSVPPRCFLTRYQLRLVNRRLLQRCQRLNAEGLVSPLALPRSLDHAEALSASWSYGALLQISRLAAYRELLGPFVRRRGAAELPEALKKLRHQSQVLILRQRGAASFSSFQALHTAL